VVIEKNSKYRERMGRTRTCRALDIPKVPYPPSYTTSLLPITDLDERTARDGEDRNGDENRAGAPETGRLVEQRVRIASHRKGFFGAIEDFRSTEEGKK
jgi:hypothetical protein